MQTVSCIRRRSIPTPSNPLARPARQQDLSSDASRAPGERASANVAFKATDPDESGLIVTVAAYVSDDEAERAFLTAPTAMRCGEDKLDLTPVTGGVAEADESQTYSATTGGFGKLALTVARRGRFLVIGAGGTAEDALEWTKLTVGRL